MILPRENIRLITEIEVNIGLRQKQIIADESEVAASGYLAIDLAALQRNYERVAAQAAPARAAAVVKANAYGLGALQISRALLTQGCRDFFVAEFVEALELHADLPGATLYVLNGLQPGNEVMCAQANIVPVANSLEQLKLWHATAIKLGRKLPVILQFDTGMSRLGIPPEDRPEAKALATDRESLDLLYVMSHLASADDNECDQNPAQLAEMQQVSEEFTGISVCFANSGGVFLGAQYHADLVRPGIALYGGAPTGGRPNPMEPVVKLDVAVVQTRTVPPGAAIGYSSSFIATSQMRLATLAIGYADGLPRSLSNRGAFYHQGVRLPIVGRVSMDSTIVDVSALAPDALQLGSLVEVIGQHQTIDDIASAADTISYEILTRLGTRYRRTYC